MRNDVENRSASGLATAAAAFVRARLEAVRLDGFPGLAPTDLATGYAIQDLAIARWPERVVGWKVGWVAPAQRDASGDPRLVGPVFEGALHPAQGDAQIEFPVFEGGFAAVEAEYVFRLARDAEPMRRHYTADEAAALVGSMHVGIETAGSPLATINALGPSVVVSDFGNNAGLIVGRAIEGWHTRPDDTLVCETRIAGVSAGRGTAAVLDGGPIGALAFALGRLAARGRALKAGDYVTTGAVTGIHDIRAGQEAEVQFEGIATLRCRAVRAVPRP